MGWLRYRLRSSTLVDGPASDRLIGKISPRGKEGASSEFVSSSQLTTPPTPPPSTVAISGMRQLATELFSSSALLLLPPDARAKLGENTSLFLLPRQPARCRHVPEHLTKADLPPHLHPPVLIAWFLVFASSFHPIRVVLFSRFLSTFSNPNLFLFLFGVLTDTWSRTPR